MSTNTTKALQKTMLLAPGGGLIAWSGEMIAQGDYVAGGAGILIGLVLVGGFVLFNEVDFAYEDEMFEALDDTLSQDKIESVGKQAAEEASEYVSEQTADDSDDDSNDDSDDDSNDDSDDDSNPNN